MPFENITIGITGHRLYPDRAAVFRGLDRLNARAYNLGGARGIDSDALEYLSRTKPGVRLNVICPNRVRNQPAAARAAIDRYATNVIELKNAGPARYQIRNKYIVDHSDRMVAFYDGRGSGGTYNTINYARAQGRPLETILLTDFDQRGIIAMSEREFGQWLEVNRDLQVPQICIKGIVLKYIKNVPAISKQRILTQFHTLPR